MKLVDFREAVEAGKKLRAPRYSRIVIRGNHILYDVEYLGQSYHGVAGMIDGYNLGRWLLGEFALIASYAYEDNKKGSSYE